MTRRQKRKLATELDLVASVVSVRNYRRTQAVLLFALLSALVWGVPAATADEASTIIERCTHGESLTGFNAAAYTTALQQLPTVVKEYTNCEDLIRAASSSAKPSTPTPVLGQSETVHVLSGTVLVRVKGTHKFVALNALTALPDGSEVDTTHGRVSITAATPMGETQTAEAYGGLFGLHQVHTGSGQTRLALSQPLTGCKQTPRLRGRVSEASLPGSERYSVRATPGRKARHIWVEEHGGSWGTDGRYVSTSVEGTRWLVLDECGRSVVEVAEGRVKVRDLIRRRTRIVTAGHDYVATQTPRLRP
jgi:hypothetical protein